MKPLTWLQFIWRIKKSLPVDRPVIVQSTDSLPLDNRFGKTGERWAGETLKYDTHYKIRINRTYSIDDKKEILMHEWGHVLAWGKDKDDHGANWGIAYAKVYRTALSWSEE